ncbi:hypothetical protein CBR_g34758 [Chara braunii]|uniref:Tyrosinase copper-binding domain-containing protein n=1 Tax=Chara braunii TaxID=69332 RepID=A0A388LJI5_CHABU|nr:hypothetical protein CBR_g34758 [Chara braunii]|eukprot:GBG82382.1 hypothetical protein CBR_g34758 [Chara braunii]
MPVPLSAAAGRSMKSINWRKILICPSLVSFSVVFSKLQQPRRLGMMTTIVMVAAMVIVLCGSSSNGHVSLASAAPIGPPNLFACTTPRPPQPNCCLPVPSSRPSAFAINSSTPLRTRRALQNVLQDARYLARLNAAYTRLRRLEREAPNDPRGLEQQRKLHCAFCSEPLVYGSQYNMHGDWFFLPWHRMLLYYHERILAWATGDVSFALPFWNWDSDAAAQKALPSPYANTTSALYTARRRAAAGIQTRLQREITRDELFSGIGSVTGPDDVIGTAGNRGYLEGYGHGAVHNAVGQEQPPHRDMGDLAWAGYDPVFYAHHANVDRMWSVWRQLPGRSDPTSADFRNSRFVFYDENANAKIIAVSDVLDHATNLRYVYENVPNSWARARRGASPAVADDGVPGELPLRVRRTFQASVTVSAENPNVATAFVQSPETTPRRGVVPKLTLRNVAHSLAEPLALYVFINEPDAGANTPRAGNPRYVGARYLVAGGMSMPVSFTFPISLTLDGLNLSLSSNFTVQVVRSVEFGASRPALSIQSIDYVHDPQV